jgi:hypothetical protein
MKKYWFDSVKLHDPNFPMEWSAAVFSKKNIITIILFWLLVILCPWGLISQIPWYLVLISFMSDIFPSINGLPAEFRHGGLMYSKAQLTAIYFFGLIFLFYALITTGSFPEKKKNIPWWTFPSMFLLFGSLFLFCIVVFIHWDGTISSSSNGYFENEWTLTGYLILFWYGMAVPLVISVAGFRTLVSKFYQFISK